MTRPFDLTLQAHRLDLHGLWLAVLAVGSLLALGWTWWAVRDHAGLIAPNDIRSNDIRSNDITPNAATPQPARPAAQAPAPPPPRPLSPVRTRPRE